MQSVVDLVHEPTSGRVSKVQKFFQGRAKQRKRAEKKRKKTAEALAKKIDQWRKFLGVDSLSEEQMKVAIKIDDKVDKALSELNVPNLGGVDIVRNTRKHKNAIIRAVYRVAFTPTQQNPEEPPKRPATDDGLLSDRVDAEIEDWKAVEEKKIRNKLDAKSDVAGHSGVYDLSLEADQ